MNETVAWSAAIIGYITSITLVGIGLVGTAFLTITWQCGQCGKVNQSNIIQFMLQWCDHMPKHN